MVEESQKQRNKQNTGEELQYNKNDRKLIEEKDSKESWNKKNSR